MKNIFVSICISIALTLGLFGMISHQFSNYDAMYRSQLDRHLNYLLAARVTLIAEETSKMARLYVTTGDPHYLDMYEEATKFRLGELSTPIEVIGGQYYWGRIFREIPEAVDGFGNPLHRVTIQESIETANLTDVEKAYLNNVLDGVGQLAKKETKVMQSIRKQIGDGELLTNGLNYTSDIKNDTYINSFLPLVSLDYLAVKRSIMANIDAYHKEVNTRTLVEIVDNKKNAFSCSNMVVVLTVLNIIALLNALFQIYRYNRHKKSNTDAA